jgi:hypothetical protein
MVTRIQVRVRLAEGAEICIFASHLDRPGGLLRGVRPSWYPKGRGVKLTADNDQIPDLRIYEFIPPLIIGHSDDLSMPFTFTKKCHF